MIELFRIMPGRYASLQDTVAGYQSTGVPLVSYTESNGIGPILQADGDDWGAYYIIPKIMDLFGLSLDASLQLLYSGTVVLAFILGSIGSWLYCKTRLGKYISILALAMVSLIVAGVGDIYIFLGATVIALIPWWLYVQEHYGIRGQLIYCAVAGLFIGFAHLMRNHSATAALIFIILSMLLKNQFSKKFMLAFCSVLLAGLFIVSISFKSFVVQKSTDYLSTLGHTNDSIYHHLFWHNVYFSLGYLDNSYGIEQSDSFAVKKALSINPKVSLYTPEYEVLLRQETLKVIKTHPIFVMNNLAAKFGVCLMYFLIFANIGIIFALYYRKGYMVDLPFAAGIAFSMLFGILTTPDYTYLLGLFSLATIYGVYSIDFALNQRVLNMREA